MIIYLAGKIGKNGWRHKLVPDLRNSFRNESGDNVSMANDNIDIKHFPIMDNAVLGKYDYCGPYFISDDHGCGHQEDSHGLSDCGETEPVIERKRIAELCLDAINVADVVFVWMDDPNEDYTGTIAEVGYAKAKGKQIFLAYQLIRCPPWHDYLPPGYEDLALLPNSQKAYQETEKRFGKDWKPNQEEYEFMHNLNRKALNTAYTRYVYRKFWFLEQLADDVSWDYEVTPAFTELMEKHYPTVNTEPNECVYVIYGRLDSKACKLLPPANWKSLMSSQEPLEKLKLNCILY